MPPGGGDAARIAAELPRTATSAEPLRSIATILASPVEEFALRRPAAVQGVVTLCEPLMIRDENDAIYLDIAELPAAKVNGREWDDIFRSLDVRLNADIEMTGVVDPGGYVRPADHRRLGAKARSAAAAGARVARH